MKINKLTGFLILVTILATSGCGSQVVSEGPTAAPVLPDTTPATEPPNPPSTCEIDQKLNPGKAVTLALPGFVLGDPNGIGVVFVIVPLEEAPTQQFNDPCGAIIGDIYAARNLPLNDQKLPFLPAGEYRIKVKDGKVSYIDTGGNELPTDMTANFKEISSRVVNPPEAIITYQDICFSWQHVQVCTEPAYQNVLDGTEATAIQNAMQEQVNILAENGLINADDINVEGTVPDVAGNDARKFQQASLLAAPTVSFPPGAVDIPVEGELLGVVYAVMDIQVDNYPTLPKGAYAIWAHLGEQGWEGQFKSADGNMVALPATYQEMRGQIERPMAIVVDLRICLCWFRQQC